MKILFFARHYSYLRLFEASIAELARRGHHLHLSADREEAMGGRRMVERLAEQYPDITLGTTPGRAPGAWSEFARRLRLGIDYLRYLDPRYADTPHLTRRARDRAPRSIVALAERTGTGGRAFLAGLLRTLERGIPVSPDLRRYIRDRSPDVVIITPLVELGSPQMDHLMAAKSLGVRTALGVASWDHLSSKALMRNLPDVILVWNEIQKQEAIDMHGVAADRVVVTGAHCYDQWFGRATVAEPRKLLLARRAADRIVRSSSISARRSSAAPRASPRSSSAGSRAIRTSGDPRAEGHRYPRSAAPRAAGRVEASRSVRLQEHRVLGRASGRRRSEERLLRFACTTAPRSSGLNTSAFLEAAVVGKPVHTVLAQEISRDNQEGTIHFHYLLDVNGGLLRVARTLDEHVPLLAESLAPEGGGDTKARAVRRRVHPAVRRIRGRDAAICRCHRDARGRRRRRVRRVTGWSSGCSRLVLYPAVGSFAAADWSRSRSASARA